MSALLYVSICTPIGSGHGSFKNEFNISTPLGKGNISDIDDDRDPYKLLKSIKISNVNRLVIGQLNINSLRNKMEALKLIIGQNIDILIITETKLDETFPKAQFYIDGYAPPFRIDCSRHSGGVIIYVRGDIPANELTDHQSPTNLEGSFFEINLKNRKWLVFGGYNHDKQNINNFVAQVGPIMDFYMSKYENFLLLGDFNSQVSERAISEFCETYNLTNLVKEPTCFKNPKNPSTIDLILTNRPRCFQNTTTIETGLSDFHKLTITVMKSYYPKQTPLVKLYRDYKNFDEAHFRNELLKELYNIHHGKLNYDTFEEIVVRLLNYYAPIKERHIRANNSPFMNKVLAKAVMTRSRLRNKFTRNPTPENRTNYTKYRNYCTALFRKEKKSYYNNLDLKRITDNRQFWKTVGPLFSDKHFSSQKITLVEGEEIISNDGDIAEVFNTYFANIVKTLDIEGFNTCDYSYNPELDYISFIMEKYNTHPSILKIN